jgi:SAM-dependent methyltransferase
MSAAAWGAYWRAAGAGQCLPGAPPAVSAALEAGWHAFARSLTEAAAVLDLATGAGAVPRALLAVRPDLAVTGIDSAPLPDMAGPFRRMGCTPAQALPFPDAAFAALTSQFGIEYAPEAALAEAARVLAPGGRLRFLVHHAQSRAIAHNRARLAAMEAMRAAGLFRLARMATIGAGDRALADALATARRAHAGQPIVDELPAALARALGTPRPLEAVAAVEAEAMGEMARISAMLDAARTPEGAHAMAGALAARGVAASVAVLAVPGEGPIAFEIATAESAAAHGG